MYPAPPTQGVAPFGVAPSGVVPAAYSTQVPQPPTTPDGFQPRGEARRRAEQQQSSTVVPATFASATLPGTGQQAYGYGASYEWLQGRLEYSAILGHWTLRYMPIGGPSDSFGGSVVIYNSDALAGYQPGDFVTMQGQLVATGIDPSMPVAYSVYTIQRQ